ncbi:MAG: CRISPR-associated endonuclease Cas6 [Cyclobacteriaceae bacterium]|nr:CRISPR-associated endonuclease Cas6 [Cyclobacteriaceae bacterium]MCX7638047.1 CRISPR-associated endonuclease Cas6 [Cyclobacteriaceae bacterium]MDW8332121.1 CRISPR-associated endonuclease Cas6 [Cyclobacteriaceae bacterium]
MKKIKVVSLVLNGSLDSNEIPQFRAAVAALVDKNQTLFHHHLSDHYLLYRYPLIQFKTINNQPAIVGLEQGADEVLPLAELKRKKLKIGKRNISWEVDSVRLKTFPVQIWNKSFPYRMNSWLALNQKNHKKFLQTASLRDRVEFLEKTLTAHILSFAAAVGWDVQKQVELFINDIHAVRPLMFKGIGMMGFDITFTANVSLPDGIGLGKAPSLGFGVVRQLRSTS